MNARPCVSVVIVTYESEAEITPCLDTLSQTASEWVREIIVIDNASKDGTTRVVNSHPSKASFIANGENIGFGRAMNQGVARAKGEYLLVLNPDCELQPIALGELVNFLDSRTAAGACGPMIKGPSGAFQYTSRRGFPTPLNSIAYMMYLDRIFPRNRMLGGYQLRWAEPATEMAADTLSGACMLIRREVFETVGGFDRDYFLFGEDIDLCWKIREAGKEIWYVPAAEVRHVKGASMRRAPHRAQHEFYESMRIFAHKRLRARYSSFTMALIRIGVDLAETWARMRTSASGRVGNRKMRIVYGR